MKKTLADKFTESIEATIDHYQSEMDTLNDLSGKVAGQMELVVELAKQVYEEGHDFYGHDYLSQHLSWEEKNKLAELLDRNLGFDDTVTVTCGLLQSLTVMIRDLKDELKYKKA